MSKIPSGIKKHPSSRVLFEFSAGGILKDADKVLLVKVENLEGKIVWTFPKGHIEKGETAEQAAVREVEEETGYRCAIDQRFEKVQYWFKHDGRLVKKTVTWFLMKPLEKTGEHDRKEILETRWVSVAEAQQMASYKSDKKLLAKLSVIASEAKQSHLHDNGRLLRRSAPRNDVE